MPVVINPVEKQHVKVDVEIERAAEALDEGDRAGVRAAAGEARLADEITRDAAVDDAEHAREGARVAGEQKAQREGQAQHPLAQGLVLRQHLLEEQRGTLCHAPRAAAGAEAAALAAETSMLTSEHRLLPGLRRHGTPGKWCASSTKC